MKSYYICDQQQQIINLNQNSIMKLSRLSDLLYGQRFKLATSDNICIFIGAGVHEKKKYSYKCVNSDNRIDTNNNLEVFAF